MSSDSVEALKKYIKSSLKKGYPVAIIEESLQDAGFSSQDIGKAFEELKIKRPGIFSRTILRPSKPEIKKTEPAKPKAKIPEKIEPPKKPKPAPKKPKKSWLKQIFKKRKQDKKKTTPKKVIEKPKPATKKKHTRWYTPIFVLIIILLMLTTITVLLLSPTTCATKECFLDKANACERATYQNSIAGAQINYESRTDCTIVKTLVKIADTEPDEIKEKFQGKSMVCAYYKNDFSPMHVETLSGLIVNCEGPLKQAIIQYIT